MDAGGRAGDEQVDGGLLRYLARATPSAYSTLRTFTHTYGWLFVCALLCEFGCACICLVLDNVCVQCGRRVGWPL